ncbi:MAG: 3-dehydroquinate synthase [Chloroflexi bacterium]|nr:3-dehydroquinate synthase [Chloroflexota bacterium]
MRGVPFIQIPTTLLAMVDSSIGGKVGVDHPRGKNLIGAFYPPRAIIADIATLNTLPEVEWRCGMSEVVKHAIVGDAKLFDWLEERRWTKDDGRWTVDERRWTIDDGRWIERALRVKVEIVARDPFERGERMKLNLGHTFAHALEIVSDFQLRHGEAVGIGLVCATRFAVLQKISDASLVERVEQLLARIGLATRIPRELSAEKIIAAMQTDKKRADGKLRLVLPRVIGDVVIKDDVAREDVVATIEKQKI